MGQHTKGAEYDIPASAIVPVAPPFLPSATKVGFSG